ncbi:Crp/Fnr family transcriptional regulator [Paraburkholderia sp. 32]|uniref:Crp/Fnr family transcriptional regulator n=1 Tax=Paraburkholderia sp. 32 TaxID=2991057 RepID=UPI003D1D3089
MSHPERALGFATLENLLVDSPWFSNLADDVQLRVRAEMWEQPVRAGVALLRRGESPNHWYGVISGLLKWSTTTADGLSITFGGMSPGSWFGEGTLWRGLPRPADVIALQPSVVAVMPGDTFHWLCETQMVFAHFLIQQLTERMYWFMEGWGAYRMLDVEGQVRRALAGLFHPWLYPHGPRHLAVSQEEIASLAGVSRPRCNRALKQLEELGLVKLEYGGLTVLDLEGLRLSVGA